MISAIFVLDKPKGPTSQKILSLFRKAFPKQRAGYTGTLDPFATGVLPIFIGGATKLIPYLDESQKIYEANLKLGEETDTLDATGRLLQTLACPSLNPKEILDLFSKWRGSHWQTPPQYSAVKIQGKPLYRYARQGIPVEAAPRKIEIYSLDLLEIQKDQIRFSATVSRGTYIRQLGADIAKALGTLGHLTELRRIKSGPFSLDEKTIGPEELSIFLQASSEQQNHKALSPFSLLKHFSRVVVEDPKIIQAMGQGQKVRMEGLEPTGLNDLMATEGQKILVCTPTHLLAIAEIQRENYLQPLRILDLPYTKKNIDNPKIP